MNEPLSLVTLPCLSVEALYKLLTNPGLMTSAVEHYGSLNNSVEECCVCVCVYVWSGGRGTKAQRQEQSADVSSHSRIQPSHTTTQEGKTQLTAPHMAGPSQSEIFIIIRED